MTGALVRACAVVSLGLLAAPALARAQAAESQIVGTIAAAAHTQSFDFGPHGDVQSARLSLYPASFQKTLGRSLAVDGYAAYGIGVVKSGGITSRLAGPVDTWLRLRWAMNSWAVAAVGVALPTGVSRHTSEQAVVANALSNDLLGFREGNWGGGGSTTFGLSTAGHLGGSRVTFGASYKVVRSFEPSADTSFLYQPGNEAKIHAGIEHSAGAGQIFFGLTAQKFSVDRADSRNLFQSGPRLRGDLSYAGQHWSVFAADMWRARGDLTLPVLDAFDGSFIRDTSFKAGWQNLGIVGVSGVVKPSDKFFLVPTAVFKSLSREDRVGRGWLATAGLTFPARIGSTEIFPSISLSRGQLAPYAAPQATQPFWGLAASFVARRSRSRPSTTE